MDIKDITVVVDQRGERPALPIAIDLANRLGGHLTGLTLVYDPVVPGYAVAPVPVDFMISARDEAIKGAKSAEAAFLAAVGTGGLSAETRQVEIISAGGLDEVVHELRLADLVIVAQDDPDQPEPVREALIESVLFHAGAPLLIVPRKDAPATLSLDRVVIAWDGTITAARSVRSALPFLGAAKAVDIVIVDDGKVVHETRVVTGKVTNQTPIFSDEMESIVVNPSWNVPASITTKEMLPKVRNDPSYLSRNGYQVLARVNGKVVPVSPGSVDWSTASARNIQIRQRPGDDNALGSIKFLFPNEHSVYLHDTPSKSLFQRDQRAFSHGCVRVQNPLEFADVLLAYQGGWSKERLRKMVGGRESWVNLPKHIPIHITYFTAFVDDSGTLQTRPDIYGYNARVERALGL